MKNKINLNIYFKNDNIQRLIYGGILFLWLFIGLNFVKYKYDFSPFYFDIFYVIVIPTIVLILPIIINRKIFWLSALIFSILHGIWTLYKIAFSYSINLHRHNIPNTNWIFKDITISITLILVSFFVIWIIWKIKPIKN